MFVAFLCIACAYKVNNLFLFPPALDYWGYPELKCCMPTTLVEIEKLLWIQCLQLLDSFMCLLLIARWVLMYFWKLCNGQVPSLRASFGRCGFSSCFFVGPPTFFLVLVAFLFAHFYLGWWMRRHPKPTIGNIKGKFLQHYRGCLNLILLCAVLCSNPQACGCLQPWIFSLLNGLAYSSKKPAVKCFMHFVLQLWA